MKLAMNNIYRFFSLALTAMLLASSAPVRAAVDNELQHPVALDSGTVQEVLKSDMIMLGDSRRFRLDNILIPPLEDAPAVDELNHALLGKHVTVYSYHDENDIHGLPLVQVITDKNLWVQGDLVSKGLAWAYSTDSSQQMAHALKVVEDEARVQQLGFWKNPLYAIKSPQTVKKFMNSYQIVEGKVLSVNQKYTYVTFLNFGKNWKTDFAVRITGNNKFMGEVKDPRAEKGRARKDARDTAKEAKEDEGDAGRNSEPNSTDDAAGFDASQWVGRIVRVRGWVHGTTAPVIDVTEKEQIDFMDDK